MAQETESLNHTDGICPVCHAKACLFPFATYTRYLVEWVGGTSATYEVTVQRYQCSSCGCTHALLSTSLVPYSSYSLRFILLVLRDYFLHRDSVQMVYARGWLNYYGIASMKNNIDDINGWLYYRICMCIWKQWKKSRTKVRNLIKMGVPEDLARQAGNSRRGNWFTTHTITVNMAMTKERLINSGFYDLATAYQSVHVNY